MNFRNIISDCVALEQDVIALADAPATQKLAADVATLLADLGLESSLHTLGGPFDTFRDYVPAIADYRHGRVDHAGLLSRLQATRMGRTPNPQRICNIIALANVIGPIVSAMIGGFTWTPIPLPAFCTAPAPGGMPARSPLSEDEVDRLGRAVWAGMFA